MSDLARVSVVRDKNMTERQWQGNVEDLLRLYGWRWYHTHDSRRSNPGYPDLTCVHALARRVLFLELKTEKGRATAEQNAWINDLRAAGQAAHIVRPRDLDLVHSLLNTRGGSR